MKTKPWTDSPDQQPPSKPNKPDGWEPPQVTASRRPSLRQPAPVQVTTGARIVFALGKLNKVQWIVIGCVVLFIIGVMSYPQQPKLGSCHSYTSCEYRSGPHLAGRTPSWANEACETSGFWKNDGHAVGVELTDWIGDGSTNGLYDVKCSDGIVLQVGH